jgi:hypothetical protein
MTRNRCPSAEANVVAPPSLCSSNTILSPRPL